ncbi:MAG TPA: pyridoxamine 5'-phosphate oxidase family protein [Slackia equolifaciens]|uniref:Pyridoxamine 5'-phosphate oxidase family protein n=1 Tax=Slackia equolifaciens TaxID=498718 RepID=A0A9D2UYN2_9ACTN|nr:pyridoxamine 5'-phosphate oxidase family protein [Slackia equolifaciens]
MLERFAATGKYTTLAGDALKASMAKVEGTSVVATVNEDGTPNAAIFVPMMADDTHLVMTLAANRTRENIERTGQCVVVYDAANPQAESKAGRHKGVRMRCELVAAESDEYKRVAEAWPRMTPYTLVLRVVGFMAIG